MATLGSNRGSRGWNGATLPARGLLALALLCVAGPARAGPLLQRLTEDQIARAVPVVRAQVRASLAAEAEGAAMNEEAAAAERSRDAARAKIRSGSIDPWKELRGRGIEAMVPPGFRYHARCSQALSELNYLQVVLVTSNPERRPDCRPTKAVGPLVHDDPQYGRALEHLRAKGFVRDEARGALRHPTKHIDLATEMFYEEPLLRCTLAERAGDECAGLPGGAILILADVEAEIVGHREIQGMQERWDAGKQSIQAARSAAGFSEAQWEAVEGALLLAHMDLGKRELMQLLGQAASTDAERRAHEVRVANLDIYERSKQRAVLEVLLQGKLPDEPSR